MLQAADVLLLDEPTNDLDIPTLEILEESLLEYRGALVLVTHDRYMLDRVSTVILGLDGRGGAERFADFQQWDEWQRSRKVKVSPLQQGGKSSAGPALTSQPLVSKKKLSFAETRDWETMEARIAEAEQNLQIKLAALEDPAIASDPSRLHAASLAVEEAQKIVDDLYARWAHLEQKKT